jgi:hypothetical protein
MAARADGVSDPVERIMALGVGYVAYAVEHPGHFRVMFSRELHEGIEDPELAAAGEPTLAALVGVVAEAQAAGQFAPGDPRALALPAWSMIHGLSMLIVDGQLPALLLDDPAGVDSLANAVADVLLRGLASGQPTRAKPRRRS